MIKKIKTLKKKSKEDMKRWKGIPWLCISRITLVKTAIIYIQIHCNPHQNSNTFLHRMQKYNFQLYRGRRKPRIIQTLLNGMNISGGITIHYLKFYYRAIIIKIEWNWY